MDVLTPDGVVAVDTRHERAGTLTAAESIGLAAMRSERRAEFVTARLCAHDALRRLGVDDVSVPRGPGGEPLWPRGTLGSITHCAGYRAAAVAHTARFLAVGIDAEPNAALPAGVLERIMGDGDERPHHTGDDRPLHTDRLLFCAKEAAFKATSARTRRSLDWRRIAVQLRLDGTFDARVATDHGHLDMRGSWMRSGAHLAAAVTVARTPR